jgi:hypothetical protein
MSELEEKAQDLVLFATAGCTITEFGLDTPSPSSGALTYETWEKVGSVLGAVGNASSWAIGDWLIWGEHVFGEKYAQASLVLGVSEESLKIYHWVASRFPKSMRDPRLTFSHYKRLARLAGEDPTAVKAWIQRAIANAWTAQELGAQLALAGETADKEISASLTKYFRATVEWPDDPGQELMERFIKAAARLGGKVMRISKRGLSD